MEHTGITESTGKLLDNPVARVVAATSLLLIAERAVAGTILGFARMTDVFPRGLERRLWNLDRVGWLAIMIVLVSWIAIGSAAKLDLGVMGGAAGAFVTLSVVIENLLFDLPDILIELYLTVAPALLLPGAALGLLALIDVASASQGTPSTAMYDAPPPSGFRSDALPEPAPAPTLVSAPMARPAVAAQEPSWLPDPHGEADLRWWDGSAWTDHTHHN